MFFQVHTRMHVFIHVRRVTRTVCIFYLLLVIVTLLRVGRRGGCSLCLFPSKTGTVGFWPLLLFLQGFSQHIRSFIFLYYYPFLICTIVLLLCSNLEGPPNFNVRPFPEEVTKFSENFWSCFQRFPTGVSGDVGKLLYLSERDGFVCPFRYLWGVSAIVDGLYGHRTLIWHRFILGCLVYPSVTYDERGVQNSQKDWFAPYLGVFSLPYFFLVSLQRRYQRAFGHPKGPQLSWGFSKVLRRTAPRMRAKSWEVCTFPSVFLVTLQRRSQWDVSLISKRNCFKPYFLKFCEEERIK